MMDNLRWHNEYAISSRDEDLANTILWADTVFAPTITGHRNWDYVTTHTVEENRRLYSALDRTIINNYTTQTDWNYNEINGLVNVRQYSDAEYDYFTINLPEGTLFVSSGESDKNKTKEINISENDLLDILNEK